MADIDILAMGLTPAEFFRCLPPALDGLEWRREAGAVTVSVPELCLTIMVEPQPERRIGGIVLPVTRVTIQYVQADAAARAAFRARFDRAFQRAGG